MLSIHQATINANKMYIHVSSSLSYTQSLHHTSFLIVAPWVAQAVMKCITLSHTTGTPLHGPPGPDFSRSRCSRIPQGSLLHGAPIASLSQVLIFEERARCRS